MKKVIISICCTALCFVFTSCGLLQSGIRFKSRSSYNNSNYISSNTDDKKEEPATTTPEQTTTFDAGKIYSGHKCTITVIDGDNERINFLLKNNSKKDYVFSVCDIAINGIMTDYSSRIMRVELPAGTKSRATLNYKKMFPDFLKYCETVMYVDVLFLAYGDLMKDFDTGVIRIKTNNYSEDKVKSNFYSGEQTQSSNQIDVSLLDVQENKIYCSVVNNNQFTIDYDLKGSSINGWAYDTGIDVYSVYVFPNCQSIFELSVDEDFLENNEIDKIKKIIFNLRIFAYDDSIETFDTNKFKFIMG